MTEDLQCINAEQWEVFKKWGPRGTDFDWFAVDREGSLAVFTTGRQGPVPMILWEHFDDFMRLRQWVAELPALAPAIQVFPGSGNYRDWSEYALKGLFAFDYQDEADGANPQAYELIAQPTASLHVSDAAVAAMAGWLPVLDVDFGAGPIVSSTHLLPYGVHE